MTSTTSSTPAEANGLVIDFNNLTAETFTLAVTNLIDAIEQHDEHAYSAAWWCKGRRSWTCKLSTAIIPPDGYEDSPNAKKPEVDAAAIIPPWLPALAAVPGKAGEPFRTAINNIYTNEAATMLGRVRWLMKHQSSDVTHSRVSQVLREAGWPALPAYESFFLYTNGLHIRATDPDDTRYASEVREAAAEKITPLITAALAELGLVLVAEDDFNPFPDAESRDSVFIGSPARLVPVHN